MLTICSSIVFSCITLSVITGTKSGGYKVNSVSSGSLDVFVVGVFSKESFLTVKMTANMLNCRTITYTLQQNK